MKSHFERKYKIKFQLIYLVFVISKLCSRNSYFVILDIKKKLNNTKISTQRPEEIFANQVFRDLGPIPPK